MHEMAVTRSMVDLVLEEARKGGARRVTRINLVLGELSGVVGDSVELYFGLMSRDTPAEGAVISIRPVPTRARCRRCATDFQVEDLAWVCPECGSISVELAGGHELFVESIEVE